MNSLKLTLLISTLIFSSAAFSCSWYMENYYVSVNGHLPTCSNPCTEQDPCTFQSALESSMNDNFDNTIHVKSGLYDLSTKGLEYNISKSDSLTIEGESRDSVILDGGHSQIPLIIKTTSSFDDSGVTINIRNLTFKDGNSTGLATIMTSSDLVVSDSSFINNGSSTGYGGVYIDNDEGNIIILKNIFRDNKALQGGGLFMGTGSGSIEIRANEFTYNHSYSPYESDVKGGGGFFILGSTTTIYITHNIIAYNTAQNSGGGFLGELISPNSKMIITNNTIMHNSAYRGGGIYAHNGTTASHTNFYNNIIWNNHANTQTNNGDAIYLNASGADCNITRNVWGDDTNSLYLTNASNVTQSLNMRQHVRISNLFLLPDGRKSARLMSGSPGVDSGWRCIDGVGFSDYENVAIPFQCTSINLGAVQTLYQPPLNPIYYLLMQ